MKLKEIREEDRPREKMLLMGAKSLTNAELLAILLRTGTGEKNVLELAQELLAASPGGLPELSGQSVETLCSYKGIGPGKAVTLAAAFELGCRRTAELMKPEKLEFHDPESVYRLMFPKMAGADHEECWALFLTRSHKFIGTERISSGGLSETTIDIASVVRKALEKKAGAVILTHNHPSGSPVPSRMDIEMTAKLKHALDMMDIALVDHVVVADSCWYSFADEETRYCGQNIGTEGN